MSAERDVEALEARLDFSEREAIRLMAEVARLTAERDEKHRQLENMHTWGEEWKVKTYALTAENERLVAQIRAALQDESGLPTRLALAVAISALLNAALIPQADAAPCEHEWVDATNEAVRSGWLCIKCYAMSATAPQADAAGGHDA